jgi:hypothetical protein
MDENVYPWALADEAHALTGVPQVEPGRELVQLIVVERAEDGDRCDVFDSRHDEQP